MHRVSGRKRPKFAVGTLMVLAATGASAGEGADDGQPRVDRLEESNFEVIRLTYSTAKSTHEPAPCPRCLDEKGALLAARHYLDEIGMEYVDLRAEILDGFGWGGTDRSEVEKRQLEGIDRKGLDVHLYFQEEVVHRWRENGMLHAANTNTEKTERHQSETWRVTYQKGWIDRKQIEMMVDGGWVPLSALAAPPIPHERSFLIHARTGVIGGFDDLENARYRERVGDSRTAVKDWVQRELGWKGRTDEE